MKYDKLNRTVLNRMAEASKKRLAERSKGFQSPGTIGRRKPVLSLTGDLASAVGAARVGEKLSFRVHGEVRAIPQRGQKPETVVTVDKVTRTKR